MAEGTRPLICGAVEGYPDEEALKRLIAHVNGAVGRVLNKGGKIRLDEITASLNGAAKGTAWTVLGDLDHDANCAPELVAEKMPRPSPYMCFRVPVRELEAWMLADRERIAAFLGVDASKVPLDPEALDDPKRSVIALARRSRKREIQKGMPPREGSGRAEGPAYASLLGEFAREHWRIDVARCRSDSLARCIRAMEGLARRAPR